MERKNNNNMEQDRGRYFHHDESPRPVPDDSGNDDNKLYGELLELMVKFGKKELKDVGEGKGRMVSLIYLIERSYKLKDLSAMKARAFENLKSGTRHIVNFWLLMTLMNPEDKEVIVAEVRQFVSSEIAINDLCDNVENYSELMYLAGTELKKIKEQYPNQVGTMATWSELQSTIELFLSFDRGLKGLIFKLKMMELHLLYPCRQELEELVDRMLPSVEDEVEQYEQELELTGAKVKLVLEENLKKRALEERKEGDDDDATANEKLQFRSLELKVREWWEIVKGEIPRGGN